ncbi:MAG: flagellar biosynthesis protein FlhF [Armatimonadota bacterium]|nr:flagellar biosynthesis protein FlhF [Armatimonadota bacterium]
MRIKTFEAPTLQDALEKARQELGEDAVVLNTRYVKPSGLLGIRGTPKVELTAAVQSEEPVLAKTNELASRSNNGVVNSTSSGSEDGLLSSADSCAQQISSETAAGHKAVDCSGLGKASSEIEVIKWELKRLGLIVENLLSARTSAVPHMLMSEHTAHASALVRAGVEAEVAYKHLADLVHLEDSDLLARALASKLECFIRPFDCSRSRVVAMVGPTGSGKTTTLAKLAAKWSIERGKDVALVTVDTYRIGAVDQLRTYARIMGVPLEVAFSPADLAAAIHKHAARDLVLIDTVGRSHRSEEHLRELKTFLDAVESIETHLVVSAALSPEVQYEVVEKFSIFSPTCLIITKLDEVSSYGVLVNLPFRSGLPISCTTSGQNVPNDLSIADARDIAAAVVGRIPAEAVR